MGTKELNARVKHKRDTSAIWTTNNPVLLNGEVIIVDTASGEIRTKTGDGTHRYTELAFDDEALRNLVDARVAISQGASKGGSVLVVGENGNISPKLGLTWKDLLGSLPG